MPIDFKSLALGLAFIVIPACGGSSTPVAEQPTPARVSPEALVPQVPEAAEEMSSLECPNAVYGSRASSLKTERGIALAFAVDDRLPARSQLIQRGEYLADMYNSVYGMEGEKTSWAKSERMPDGVRIDFSVITNPDLDESIEPIPESSQDELAELRERITGYLLAMQQQRHACPLMRALIKRGAELPPYAQRTPGWSEEPY